MVELLRHRQTKEAETDMLGLTPPRHIPTLRHRVVAAHCDQWHETGSADISNFADAAW